jgi:hypothetical protein
MGERPVLTARLSERTLERLEQYADREGMSKSKAADYMIKQGLDVQESDMRLVPVKADGGIEQKVERVSERVEQTSEDVDDLRRLSEHYAGILVTVLLIGGIVTFPGFSLPILGAVLVLAIATLIRNVGGSNE